MNQEKTYTLLEIEANSQCFIDSHSIIRVNSHLRKSALISKKIEHQLYFQPQSTHQAKTACLWYTFLNLRMQRREHSVKRGVCSYLMRLNTNGSNVNDSEKEERK